jgi:hypothetical protein
MARWSRDRRRPRGRGVSLAARELAFVSVAHGGASEWRTTALGRAASDGRRLVAALRAPSRCRAVTLATARFAGDVAALAVVRWRADAFCGATAVRDDDHGGRWSASRERRAHARRGDGAPPGVRDPPRARAADAAGAVMPSARS